MFMYGKTVFLVLQDFSVQQLSRHVNTFRNNERYSYCFLMTYCLSSRYVEFIMFDNGNVCFQTSRRSVKTIS